MGGSSSTSLMSLFLIAKPTPCSLSSSSPLPCQKNVYSFSLRLPEPSRRVSCKAAMSTFSLASSLLIMAVLRGPSVFRMSVVSPVSIVRTFQLPRVRVCLFLFNPFFLGEIVAVHLSVCFQTSVQLTPAEQADCGGKHLIDWGLPSLSGR